MDEHDSPRLLVLIDAVTAPTWVLAQLKEATSLGFAALIARIAARLPVLDRAATTDGDHGAVLTQRD